MVAGMEPNAENKLFVGGCPAGSGEEDLRASNTNVTMFLVPPDIIQQYRLPLWIKGCNEVGNRTTKQ